MSAFVKLQNISFTYDNLTQNILNEVTLSFHAGWTSICGVNGSGKTTLCKLIEGKLKPQDGFVQVQGSILSIPQSTEEAPSNLEDFQYDYSKQAIKLRGRLNIQDDFFDSNRWNSLSIGERKKLQVASALFENPHILIVDEPTNHVDAESKEVILQALKKFKGIGVLISHDRLLLNQLCGATVFLENERAIQYQASYNIAKLELEQKQKGAQAEYSHANREYKNLKSSIQKQSEKIAQRQKGLSKKDIDKHDHDAKEKVNLAKLTGADSSDAKTKKRLDNKIKNKDLEISNIRTKIKKEYDLGVFFGELNKNKKIFFKSDLISKSYIKLKCPDIYLNPGDKLAILGPNGMGKSTLLKHWIKTLDPQDYVYAPQEFSLEEIKELSQELNLLEPDVKGQIMTLVSCLGSDPKTIAAGSIPSPGVWQKLMISKAIVEGAPTLLLDEPTNHMDLAAIEVLEEALQKYEGILILISHDAEFVERVCDKKLEILDRKNGQREAITPV